MKRTLLVILTLLGATGCDQATKRWAERALADGPSELLGGRIELLLTTNRGAFLSFGEGLPDSVRTAVFTICVAVALAAGIIWLLRSPRDSSMETAALALVFGGGIGNVIDRATNAGAVTDFIFIRLGPLRTGIFNVADVCVTAGVAMLLAWHAVSARRAPSPDSRR